MLRSFCFHPLVIAVAITGLNALKPVAVDDTAYLTFARHIASHPFDPYGFEQFWNAVPEPAMDVLAPPVLPYWLAAGITSFGENEFLLKMWLFPFATLLTYSLRSLARRFANGTERLFVPIVCFSGVVLPLFGFMLDLPAMALSLTAVALFVKGGAKNVAASGFVLALAMQTKYTAIICPAVIGWYGLTFGRFRSALVSILIAIVLFGAWEFWLHSRYGRSHFLFHAFAESQSDDWLEAKLGLVKPLLSYLGGLAVGSALFAFRATGWWKGYDWLVAFVALLGFAFVAFFPERQSLAVARILFPTLGIVFFLSLIRAMFKLGLKNRTSRFLIGWFVLEIVAYFVLTPFPAGRRVIGVAMVSAILFARTVSLANRALPSIGILSIGPILGLSLFAIDCWDARPEKVLALDAATVVKGKSGTVWFNGHWGFQYYCERAGMKPVVPDVSTMIVGDWLVYPAIPDEVGFYRPFHGGAKFEPDERFLNREAELVTDDWLSATTIPTLYGGSYPLIGRSHPRLRVIVYRVIETYRPEKVP